MRLLEQQRKAIEISANKNALPVETRKLWSESGENVSETLQQSLAAVEK